MTLSTIDALARRRDIFIRAAKALLIGATIVWLTMMAFYDRSFDGSTNTILLPTRTSFLLLLDAISPLAERRIWGGPTTLFGMQCLVGTFGTIATIAFVRARLNHGRISRIGICFGLLAIIMAVPTVSAGAPGLYPVTLNQPKLAQLTATIERREPGLIARLNAGERPALPATGGGSRRLAVGASGRIGVADAQGPLLRDRDDGESLRFVLAEQALAKGDIATLRHLLPIDLAMPPTDLPARNDFARRLVAMGTAAGVSPVPEAQRETIAAWAGQWDMVVAAVRYARILMQLMLWTGLSCGVLGLILRWSHNRISAQSARLYDEPAEPFQPAHMSARRRNLSNVTAP